MSMIIEDATRVFKHDGNELTDPDINMSPEEVRDYYANTEVSLTNATVNGPELDEQGRAVYEFSAHVGKFG